MTQPASYQPQRGYAVSFWLMLRSEQAAEHGASEAAAVAEKMLREYHWCADHYVALPVTSIQTVNLTAICT